MSATNTTTNYNLPIFIGSDKPSWLADFNGAMTAIDAQMKTNADAIATKSPILTFNDTTEIELDKTGNVVTATLASGVSDKVGRALVKPLSAPAAEQIVGVDTNGDQAAIEIGSGLFNDGGVLKAVDLNLTDIGTATISGLPTGVTVSGGALKYALNADKSIGKIYGTVLFRSTSSSNQVINATTNITVKATGEAYSIAPAGLVLRESGYAYSNFGLNISAAGAVSLSTTVFANNTTAAYVMPCIYFFTNFGDVNP